MWWRISPCHESGAPKTNRKAGGHAAINGHAIRAVVQILFATGKAYTIETLREKLREFFLEEGDFEKRAVASMSSVQLITAMLEASSQFEALGLQIRCGAQSEAAGLLSALRRETAQNFL